MGGGCVSMQETVRYRLIVPGDATKLRKIFGELRPSIAGLTSRDICLAMYRDALVARYVVVVLALQDDQPCGFVIAIINWRTYWQRFCIRHPILAVKIAWKRMVRRICGGSSSSKRVQNDEDARDRHVGSEPSDRCWKQSSPQIAKIVFIGVALHCRGQGIGRRLLEHLFRALVSRRIKRVDARISAGNTASTELFRKSGWLIEQDGLDVFATIDLPVY